jgi:hypothetical protein
MGVGIAALTLLDRLFRDGALPRRGAVMELGAQELLLKGYEQALDTFGGLFEVPLAQLAVHDPRPKKARALYDAIGWQYACIDIDADEGVERFDLNRDAVPGGRQHDLVTNLGTTEHVLNQANCFPVMHDFTRPGGVMVHGVPCLGYLEHGFFNYHPNFFHALAAANAYEILGVYYCPTMSSATLIPWSPEILGYLTMTAKTAGGLFVALRRTTGDPFAAPQQGRYGQFVPAPPLDGRVLNGGVDAHEQQVADEKARRKAERLAARNAERDREPRDE